MTQASLSNPSVFNVFLPLAEQGVFGPQDGTCTYLSEEVTTPFLFDTLVPSVNYTMQAGGCLLLEAQVKQHGVWSKFFKIALFSQEFQCSFPAQKSAFGEVDADVLKVFPSAESFRLRLQAEGQMQVFFLAACVTRADFAYDEARAVRLPDTSIRVPVRPISQMELSHEDRKRVCSPVALTMALNCLGVPVGVMNVLSGVFDTAAGIYGNWLFNTAYVARWGLEGFVRRFESLAELDDFISPAGLVLASIGYKEGELANAAIAQTLGHLVLIHGCGDGKIFVSDPAASTAQDVNRVYDAREFAAVWLKNKKGIAYIVRKK